MKRQNGITLVALIITIIVLLILAGVSLLGITGEDSIIDKTILAKDKTAEAAKNESSDLKKMDTLLTFTTNPSALIPGSYDSEGKLIKTWDELKADKDITFGYEGYDNYNDYVGAGAGDDSYLTGVSDEIEYIVIDGSQVKTITDNVFNNNDVIKSVKVTNGLETIGYKAFYGSDSIEEIVLPDSIRTIAQGAFQQSTVKSGRIYKDVTYSKNTYYACPQLENIVIDEGVTTITENMIRDCISLRKIVVPASVTSIGSMAFRDCERMSELYILSEDATIDSGAVQKNKNATGEACNFTIYVVNEVMKERCEALAAGNVSFTVEIIETEN